MVADMKSVPDTATQKQFLPYGRQDITPEDIQSVVRVLESDLITQGPTVPQLEKAIAAEVGATDAVLVSNGTAALHCALMALGVGPGDWVITSANSFLASANCARYVGAEVDFADVIPTTGLIDPESLRKVCASKPSGMVKAIIPVHFAGQPADLDAVAAIAKEFGAAVVSDGCHALGARVRQNGGQYAIGGDAASVMTAFSFHPVKHVAMGEGGAITTGDKHLAEKLRLYRNHGMRKDSILNAAEGLDPEGEPNPWYYEMHHPGYNFRVTEMQAALGLSQIKRLKASVRRRNEIAYFYTDYIFENFDTSVIRPLDRRNHAFNSYHLFVLLIDFDHFGTTRARVMNRLRAAGIGTQVHYIPIFMQPYYSERYGHGTDNFPGMMSYYRQALSIPMYPTLTDSDCTRVMRELKTALGG
jgi:UDP-4-amino-4,6-dideoxy-N-acetyl-beta-L-altrosamine transaminase